MLGNLYSKITKAILKQSLKNPFRTLIITILLTLPAIYLLGFLQIDTDLIRLLPDSNRSSLNTRQLQDKVGDGGHFIALFESKNRTQLVEAVKAASEKFKNFDEIESVQLKFPVDFIDKYGFTLIPTEYLNKLYDSVLSWEAEVNPFVDNLDETEGSPNVPKTHGDMEDEQDMKIMLRQYMDKPEYYENEKGTVIGIMLPTKHGVMSIGKIQDLYNNIQKVSADIGKKYRVWTGIGGNHRNKINELSTITGDLNRSSLIAGILIILLLLFGFRSISPLIAVIYPLLIGLIWGFALVPFLIGPLNLITSFLMLIMFGMGIDFSIHLVKRFLQEIQTKDIETAMYETYKSTGVSVLISGLTTALSLSILAISGFRGFSEFGIISAISIISILLAMFLVLPPILVIMRRMNMLKKATPESKKAFVLSSKLSIGISLLFVGISIYAFFGLEFDYNLSNIDFDKNKTGDFNLVREKQKEVYSMSMSPAAIYLVHGINALDSLIQTFKNEKQNKSSMIGRIRSIRDFAPGKEESTERLELIEEIRDALGGEWVNKIEDSSSKAMVEKFLKWDSPEKTANIDDIPDILKRSLIGRDVDEYYLFTLYPKEERKDGRNAMAFAKDIYSIKLPKEVRGPIGETVVFAELLWLVLGEGLLLGLATFISVSLIVYFSRPKIGETCLILTPLILGMGATLGLMAIIGMKISLFNIIVIPALIGMGVDGGVHYVRRWLESGRETQPVQKELMSPLSLATFTTLLGYSGMVFAHHSGIRSIGLFACLGLTLIWFTTLVLLPGLLNIISNRKK